MSRDELAEKLGVSFSTVAAYEQGIREVPGEKIIKMGDIFGVPISYLIGDSDIYDKVTMDNLTDEERAYILIMRSKKRIQN